jgi:ADP-ribosylglycohydrolase
MEAHEFEMVHVPLSSLAAETDRLGIEWHNLPIRDVDVPDESFEGVWTYSGTRLRTLLSQGSNVVIHCLGGRGRSGTIAARLLVELGHSPADAISAVRQARHGAIETRAQEEYVRTIRLLAQDAKSVVTEQRLGCILGGALGDAFGYAIEFTSIENIRRNFGRAGLTSPVYTNGMLNVSDDTQMTLFTLQGLLSASETGDREALGSIRAAYMEWLYTQHQRVPGQKAHTWLSRRPEMYASRAPGNTCLSALRAGGCGSIDKPANDSKGCGGVMRTAPIGLLTSLTTEKAFELGAQAAALTHGHPSGYLSAGTMSSIVRLLVGGTDMSAAVERSCEVLSAYSRHQETTEAVHEAIALAGSSRDHVDAIRKLGGGWVGEEALAIALYSVLSAETFVEAIQIAANHSGDSDSTASIAGQLWGSQHGIEGMPHQWIQRIDVLLPALHLVRELDLVCGR